MSELLQLTAGSPYARSYRPIEDYALLSNCEGSALVARDGSIDWACLQSFDAAPTFSRLLDRLRGGYFILQPVGNFETTREYLGRTNILATTFIHGDGIVTVHDFMARPGPSRERPCLVRHLVGISGRVPMIVRFRPLDGFSTTPDTISRAENGLTVGGRLSLGSELDFEISEGEAIACFDVTATQWHSLLLYLGDLPVTPPDVPALMDYVRAAWTRWSSGAAYTGPLSGELNRSALVLKALVYTPTGAIVAAATTSLPEEIGGIRNWDYRYCWIRDACLSFYVLKKFGMTQEAEHFFGFISTLVNDDDLLRPLYGVRGETTELTEHEIAHFEGWQGSAPVRHGNKAAEQHQADAYGQLLDLFHFYDQLGGKLTSVMQKHAIRLADIAAAHWRRPDAGLWEPRKPEQRYLHAAIMNWVALDRAIRLFGERPQWTRERDAIVACVNGAAVHAEGFYPQYIGSDDVDTALLIAPLVGFPVDRRIFEKTVNKIIDRLGHGHLVYRYRNDDGLPGHEGTFLICAFWMVDALLWLGREKEARARFEALRALQNDVGLYSEEISENGSFLGNFPQAFSHLAFVHSALLLDLFEHGGQAAITGAYADRALRETPTRRAPKINSRPD
ncbi:glucoamylase [Acetobacter nitrogenifigens DSM 23921 = NBRC 105050]|uniref:Glycosyl hydrolase n=1 Tax=Acetobacter nitrogenifigens DSM 23921 = NBRC 105050 TaxID=1120919 RepID=A0A511XB52_9PROT|nr:glycoside hydrolase family 15 protein [Acetobacter nitrogenifigens]GBQ93033.1 glucoamylase [Acetobacter nitrogenifigens DSM 23921 = NBRC 105050]GEN60198.1 glycosyl hydrolase [Acetobacter nitrogenifigens DSM 23921 = NBRC 105050]